MASNKDPSSTRIFMKSRNTKFFEPISSRWFTCLTDISLWWTYCISYTRTRKIKKWWVQILSFPVRTSDSEASYRNAHKTDSSFQFISSKCLQMEIIAGNHCRKSLLTNAYKLKSSHRITGRFFSDNKGAPEFHFKRGSNI